MGKARAGESEPRRSAIDRRGIGRAEPQALVWGAMGIALLYFALFYTTSIPALRSLAVTNEAPRRVELLALATVSYGQVVDSWSGDASPSDLHDRLPVLLLAAAIVFVAVVVGWCGLRASGADRGLAGLELLVFSAGAGLNIVSLYVLLVGLAGQLHHPWLFVAPAAGCVLAAAVAWRRRLGRSSCGSPPDGRDFGDHEPAAWLGRGWLCLAVPFAVVIVLGAMLPPIDFDVREYHLQAPKEFFQRGRITFLPHNVYGNMPLGPQMYALLAMVIRGDWWTGALVGKTVIGAYSLLTGAALYAAGRRFFCRPAGVLAAVVYLSIPWIVRVSTLGLVEGPYAFFLFLAVYATVLWWQTTGRIDRAGPETPSNPILPPAAVPAAVPGGGGRRAATGAPQGKSPTRLLALAGFMAGGAVSCKYPALLFVVAPLAGFVCFAAGRRGLRATRPERDDRIGPRPLRQRIRNGARAGIIFLAAAATGCGPWFCKNLVLTGNPVYPLLYRVFDGATRTAEKDDQWRRAHRPHGFSAGAAGRSLAAVLVRSDGLSPLVLPLAVLALATGRRRRRLAIWLWLYVIFVLVCWWLGTHRIDRFWIPVLPVLALLAGLGATWTVARVWRIGCRVALVVGVAANLVLVTSGLGGYNRYLMAYQDARVSLERVDPWHLYLNRHVPRNHAVLLVGDGQAFDLEVPVFYNTVFDDCIFQQQLAGRSPAQFQRWLLEHRISHIYVDWSDIARYRSPGNYGFTDFVQPDVFERLLACGVLAPATAAPADHRGQVFVTSSRP